MFRRILLLTALLAMVTTPVGASETKARIKDLAFLAGTTPEPLLGYGLVTGLQGTGDGQNSSFTVNSFVSMLERLGITVDPNVVRLKNVAAVLVSASVDPTAALGERFDVQVSSIGDCTSLEGGSLVMTSLNAADGTGIMVAQGAVSIGGFNIKSGANNSFRKNHATVGNIPAGGTIRYPMTSRFVNDGAVTWLLHNADFHTSSSLAGAVNAAYGEGTAQAMDAHRVQVMIPEVFADEPIPFIADMGLLTTTSDTPARVVINERTGTIIVGKNVTLKEAAVAHGNLSVEVKTYYDVSQPTSFQNRSQAETVVVPDVNTKVDDGMARVLRVPESSTVADVVAVLNDIGASPRDIIAILEALKRAGSLQAELVIM